MSKLDREPESGSDFELGEEDEEESESEAGEMSIGEKLSKSDSA